MGVSIIQYEIGCMVGIRFGQSEHRSRKAYIMIIVAMFQFINLLKYGRNSNKRRIESGVTMAILNL